MVTSAAVPAVVGTAMIGTHGFLVGAVPSRLLTSSNSDVYKRQDSGVGGLTVVREIMRNLPDERIVYFGDTARVPYGSKSKNTVIRYSRQIVHFLETQQVKAIVIACNTASALALDTIEKEIDLPIIGVRCV